MKNQLRFERKLSWVNNTEYDRLVKAKSPGSPLGKDMLCAFLIGGAICAVGQALNLLYTDLSGDEKTAATLTSVSLVFLSALFTALGLYDKLAKFGGAGTLVPITGFANAVVSPAIEFKPEGWIMGIGASIFKIAGPVIVYGEIACVLYGVIYWILSLVR